MKVHFALHTSDSVFLGTNNLFLLTSIDAGDLKTTKNTKNEFPDPKNFRNVWFFHQKLVNLQRGKKRPLAQQCVWTPTIVLDWKRSSIASR